MTVTSKLGDDDDDVYRYYIRWRLKLEGETMSAAAFQFDLLSTNLILVLLQHDCMSRSSSSFYSEPIRLKVDVHFRLLAPTDTTLRLPAQTHPRLAMVQYVL